MDKLLELWVKAQNYKSEVDERGAAGVEYGLLVALIAAVIILTVTAVGTKVNTAFTTVRNNLP
ncbi:MAG TPA: Flp family type IVb pilin [Acidimicrobiia bacterium]|jgi:pilus assembly protein Flp/PilA|nr:Flp family type IVb pilin [Acidimicrobiia bacterium]